MSEKTGQYAKEAGTKIEDPVTGKPKQDFSQSADSMVEQVLHLQRTIGNPGVTRLIQSGAIHAKPRTDQPGDIYEQEADRLAERVMRMTGQERQAEPAPAFIVEDTVIEAGPGQMTKSEFLSLLQEAVRSTAEEALAGTGRTAEDCPYIEYWFGFYSDKDSRYIERAVHMYAPGTLTAASAEEYIRIIRERVRKAVEVWAKTGEITGVPEGVPLDIPGTVSNAEGDVHLKTRGGSPGETGDVRAIRAQLGTGRAFDGPPRSRMESAFGLDFSHVRVHTGPNAAQLSRGLNARAFTIGSDIAFDTGEYRPGTLVGDALIAHELAHVAQQGSSSTPLVSKSPGNDSAIETDADSSAVWAVLSLWARGKAAVKDIAQNAMPRLKSGLRLSRCFQQDYYEFEPVSIVFNDDGVIPPIGLHCENQVEANVYDRKQLVSESNPIELAVEGVSDQNGAASIDKSRITNAESCNLTVRGDAPTRVENEKYLELAAKWQGEEIPFRSDGFAVIQPTIRFDENIPPVLSTHPAEVQVVVRNWLDCMKPIEIYIEHGTDSGENINDINVEPPQVLSNGPSWLKINAAYSEQPGIKKIYLVACFDDEIIARSGPISVLYLDITPPSGTANCQDSNIQAHSLSFLIGVRTALAKKFGCGEVIKDIKFKEKGDVKDLKDAWVDDDFIGLVMLYQSTKNKEKPGDKVKVKLKVSGIIDRNTYNYLIKDFSDLAYIAPQKPKKNKYLKGTYKLTYDQLKDLVKLQNGIFFEEPYFVNIMGLRGVEVFEAGSEIPGYRIVVNIVGKWDDTVIVLYKDHEGKKVVVLFEGTVDPGEMEAEETKRSFMPEGNYMFKIETHKGYYPALVPISSGQTTPGYRFDEEENEEGDTILVPHLFLGTENRGSSGIHIHTTHDSGDSEVVKVEMTVPVDLVEGEVSSNTQSVLGIRATRQFWSTVDNGEFQFSGIHDVDEPGLTADGNYKEYQVFFNVGENEYVENIFFYEDDFDRECWIGEMLEASTSNTEECFPVRSKEMIEVPTGDSEKAVEEGKKPEVGDKSRGCTVIKGTDNWEEFFALIKQAQGWEQELFPFTMISGDTLEKYIKDKNIESLELKKAKEIISGLQSFLGMQ